MSAVLTDATVNALLGSSGVSDLISHISLGGPGHPGSTGANELAVTRQAVAWDAAASRAIAMTGTETFSDVPAAAEVRYVLFWSALSAGTFRGYALAGSTPRRAFTADAGGVTADELDSPAHGYTNGTAVLVWATIGAGLPTGLSEDTIYYVVGATTDTFQLSLTSGGSAINLTGVGDGDVQKLTPEVFGGPGSYQVSSLSISLPG